MLKTRGDTSQPSWQVKDAEGRQVEGGCAFSAKLLEDIGLLLVSSTSIWDDERDGKWGE